ncbi:MAG: hypothetical protein JXR78_02245, partial [Victivallales bacterium]|nr:hypothetical protein [Victivallales bacterium]
IYTFHPEKIDIDLFIDATEDINMTRFMEVIPVPLGEAKSRDISISKESSTIIKIHDTQNHGVVIQFNSPQEFHVCKNGLKNGSLQIGRIEIILPSKLRKGQQINLKYQIIPIPAK